MNLINVGSWSKNVSQTHIFSFDFKKQKQDHKVIFLNKNAVRSWL